MISGDYMVNLNDTKEINTEKIMEDIRKDIERRGLREEKISFNDVFLDISNPIIIEGSLSYKYKTVRFFYLNVFSKLPPKFQILIRKILKK